MADEPMELLLVEDNASDVELVLHSLKKNNFANRIRVARDGAEALEIMFGSNADSFTGRPPSLILLDLKLPKADGLEVLSRSCGSAERLFSDPEGSAAGAGDFAL
jgi:two-component system response regulator